MHNSSQKKNQVTVSENSKFLNPANLIQINFQFTAACQISEYDLFAMTIINEFINDHRHISNILLIYIIDSMQSLQYPS